VWFSSRCTYGRWMWVFGSGSFALVTSWCAEGSQTNKL
jgi:hypothetical protein